jgi:hypothetical protein
MGGFECTDQLNAFGHRVDLLGATGHLEIIDQDYENLALLNIKTVREGIQWSRVEIAPYVYDWSALAPMVAAAKRHGIQQVWDLCHFGFPDDLTPLHPMFARRFAALCREFVRAYRELGPGDELIITPINEVGFISWLGGDVRGTSPYCTGQGWEVKYALMRAYIEGVAALKREDESIRIMSTEPLVNITAAEDAGAMDHVTAAMRHNDQFQATDILCGKMCPELGGSPEYLDIVGVNYYYNNQWLAGSHQMLGWNDETMHPNWRPLAHLLEDIHRRYGRPLVISETSHPHEDRPVWIERIADECAAALEAGVELWGVCWYPIIDRPDWDHLDQWHRSGIWDRDELAGGNFSRQLHQPTATAFLAAQAKLARHVSEPFGVPV